MAEPEAKGNGFYKKLGRRVIHSANLFDYEQEGFEVVTRFMSNPDDFSDEQISGMIDRVYPPEYARKVGWKEGDYKKGRDLTKLAPRVAERMDMVRMAIGDPQVYGTMKESVYEPGEQKERKEGEKFYTYKDRSMVKQLFDMVKKHIPTMEKETTEAKKRGKKKLSFNVSPHKKDIKEGDARFKSSMKHVGLERYQVSVGEDDIGKYMAIYDPWDIDYDVPVLSSVARKAIPGFQFYDRVYYEAKAPESDLKIRKGEQEWPPEAKYASPMRQGIQDKVMDWLHRVF